MITKKIDADEFVRMMDDDKTRHEFSIEARYAMFRYLSELTNNQGYRVYRVELDEILQDFKQVQIFMPLEYDLICVLSDGSSLVYVKDFVADKE